MSDNEGIVDKLTKKPVLTALGLTAVAALGAGAAYYLYHSKKHAKFSRLPTSVIPLHYDLRLNVFLAKHSFSGNEEIVVQVRESVNQIKLNAAELNVHSAEFSSSGGTYRAEIVLNKEDELVIFKFSQKLPVGEGRLRIEFEGTLNDKMRGFYRSTYQNERGEPDVMAVTQFEPTDARRCFPSWDEPAVKATFKLSLTVPKGRVAISNTPIVSSQDLEDGTTLVVFDKTPKMSTYLVAIVVGEFDYVEGTTSSGTQVKVFTPVKKKEQGKFALEVALKTLPFYETFFGIAYPLKKCDLIAIPDFSAGAMENWGAITYRETALLVDPVDSSSAAKQWVALVVGHELAHQWFGNLVTMEWWTHLWLNEGFASFVEYICVDHCFPEWDIWTQFVFQDFGRALSLDSLENSHPIEVEVGHPNEIDEIFDAISYSKGSVVIRMLNDFLGKEAFSKGLNNYLKHFEYSNALTEDLWFHLGQASNKPVKELMNTWTKQTGYPVLTISETTSEEGRTFSITQKRFLNSRPSTEQTKWAIPLAAITPSGKKDLGVFETQKGSFLIKGLNPGDWIKFNPSQIGFYRCNYSPELLAKLQGPIENKTLNAVDRLGVQNDILFLAKAGLASTVEALKLISHYTNETDFTVWSDLTTNLFELDVLLANTEYYNPFKRYCANLYRNISAKLGWQEKKDDTHLDKMTRPLVLGQLGKYGESSAVDRAKALFDTFLKDRNSLEPDLRKVVYSIVIANGDENTFNDLIKIHNESSLPEEKVRVLRSLGNATDEKLLQRTLEFALSPEVRSQDCVFVIETVALNRYGRELAWKFIRDKWDVLSERYKGGFLLSRLLKSSLSYFTNEEKAREIEAFFRTHKAEAAERTLKQALESIRSYVSWLKRDGPQLKQFFSQNS